MKPVNSCTETAKLIREAARNAEKRGEAHRVGACIEMNRLDPNGVTYSHHNPLCKRFRAIFNQDANLEPPTIWGWDDESQDERIVALCLFAAMVKAGDA